MQTHGLLIADEPREGNIPLSVLFAGALKERGYKIRLFQIGFDETLTKYLEAAAKEPVTVIDPHMLHTDFNCRRMAYFCSDSSCLNLFIGPLSEPQLHEEEITVHPSTMRVGEILSLPIVPLLYADKNAILTARLTGQIFSQLAKSYPGLQLWALCYAMVLNPREYQLLEIEIGRRLPYISLGYIPKSVVRSAITPKVLFSEPPSSSKLLSLHSSVRQLAGMDDMVNWPVLGALAKRLKPWTSIPEELRGTAKTLKMGVLEHAAFGGAGDGNQRFLQFLGFEPLPVTFESMQRIESCDILYIPHGRAVVFQNHENLRSLQKLLGKAVFRKIPFYVEGETAILLGKSLSVPEKSSLEGLSMFAYHAKLLNAVPSSHEIRLEATSHTPILRKEEIMHGYRTNGYSLSVPESSQGSWSMRRLEAGGEVGTDGWFMGEGIVARSCISFWEIPQGIHKWLHLP